MRSRRAPKANAVGLASSCMYLMAVPATVICTISTDFRRSRHCMINTTLQSSQRCDKRAFITGEAAPVPHPRQSPIIATVSKSFQRCKSTLLAGADWAVKHRGITNQLRFADVVHLTKTIGIITLRFLSYLSGSAASRHPPTLKSACLINFAV